MTDQPTRVLPFGSWPSPVTAASLVRGVASVGEIRSDGTDVWWSEQRPDEGGRTVLVRRSSGGFCHDLLPAFDAAGERRNWNVRTALLEYGGGAWAVREGVVVFADWADQRLHRVDPSEGEAAVPVPITPEPRTPRGLRYSEVSWLEAFPGWLICVRESHEPEAVEGHGEAIDQIVAVPLDGSAVGDPSRVIVLAEGADFVHSPVAQGTKVAWIRWDHPRMPWDGTELVGATLVGDPSGAPERLVDERVVAGGPEESVVQPGFLADGSLVFCTDRTGWWNPWRERAEGEVEAMIAAGDAEVEIGGPLWVGGSRWWTEIAPGRLLVSARSSGSDSLAVLEPDGELRHLDTPFTEIGQVVAAGDGHDALVVAGTPTSEATPSLVDVLEDDDWPMAGIEQLRHAHDGRPSRSWISVPEAIEFESTDGRVAHALWYPPHHPEVRGPADERPPLIVVIHGGPTSAARHVLSWAKQFWTTRGFAVVDVDHGGSTGYGRPFRRLLDGRWGVVDVQDAVAAARHLAQEGHVDPDRLAIRGGSAGGFTTLAALCFHDAFAAGASSYGIADLSALAEDTHKFESRYLDSLVGRWPEDREVYEARSPIHHTEGFSSPLLVLQGSDDPIVPPNQAEMIVDALADRGIAHAFVLFEGEQHGFRKAENVVRALEAELWFFGRVFDFEPADEIEPVAGAVGLG